MGELPRGAGREGGKSDGLGHSEERPWGPRQQVEISPCVAELPLAKLGLPLGMARAGRDGPPFSWDPHDVCGGRVTMCALLCPHATLVLLGPPGLGCVLSLITQPPTQLLPWAPRILEAQLLHWLAEVRRQGAPLSLLLGWTHTISQLFLCGCGQCWRKRETLELGACGWPPGLSPAPILPRAFLFWETI